MFADRNASLFPSAGATLSCLKSPWPSDDTQASYSEALHRFECASGNRPGTPNEIASLIQSGHFEEAVRGLSFIISSSELSRRLSTQGGTAKLSFYNALEQIVTGQLSVDLSPAERSVVTMLHALRVTGLDSATHPSDRVLELVAPFAAQLNADLDPRHETDTVSWSYRMTGAASLIAAQASKIPAAQPCGVQILKMAQDLGIPRIMITSHHSLGGDAVPLIAEHCAREQLLNGQVSCARLGYETPNPDIFWVFKEDPQAWLNCFERLASKCVKGGHYIVLVEDTLGPLSDDPLSIPVEDVIRQAYQRCSHFAYNPLTIVSDGEEAIHAITNLPVGGVVTDLFIPTRQGSLDKSCGEATVREVLAPYLTTAQIDHLLCAARAMEGEVASVMERELHKLLQVA